MHLAIESTQLLETDTDSGSVGSSTVIVEDTSSCRIYLQNFSLFLDNKRKTMPASLTDMRILSLSPPHSPPLSQIFSKVIQLNVLQRASMV